MFTLRGSDGVGIEGLWLVSAQMFRRDAVWPRGPPPVLPPASGSSASPSGSRAEQGIAVGSGGEGKAAANQDRSIKRPPLAVIRALVEVAGQATPLLSREFVQRFAPRLAERLIPLLLDMPDTELRGMCRGDA